MAKSTVVHVVSCPSHIHSTDVEPEVESSMQAPIRAVSQGTIVVGMPLPVPSGTWPLPKYTKGMPPEFDRITPERTGCRRMGNGALSSKWLELWVRYEMLSKSPVDLGELEGIAVNERAKGKLLQWSARDGQWEVVSHLFDMAMSVEEKRRAFGRVAGSRRASGIPLIPDHIPGDASEGRREAMGFALGLAAMAAHFDEQASALVDGHGVEIPSWVLAECIRLDGPGGKRLLEKCLHSRENGVTWTTPTGSEVVHDQMAFIGPGPKTAMSVDQWQLSAPTEILLPHKLEFVDLLDRNQVTRTRAEVRVFTVKDACSPDLIKALAASPSNGCFTTDAARAIIEQAWLGALAPYTFDCALNAVYVMALCQVTGAVRHGESGAIGWKVILALITSKDVLEELLQLRHTEVSLMEDSRCRAIHILCSYICSLEQASDWAGIAIDIVGIFTVCSHWHCFDRLVEPLSRTTLAIWAALRWLRALYGLRGYERIGKKMLPILNTLQDTMIFMLVVSFFLAAAVHAYYVLGVRSEPSPLYASMLAMLRLSLFGDFDLFELEGEDPSYVLEGGSWKPVDPKPTQMYVPVHVLFYAVGAFITLTLMNLLIGILSANYDRFEDQSIQIFLRSRASILVRHGARPWARAPWSVPFWNNICSSQDRVSRKGYLWVATQAEVNLDEVRSLRTIFREELKRSSRVAW